MSRTMNIALIAASTALIVPLTPDPALPKAPPIDPPPLQTINTTLRFGK